MLGSKGIPAMHGGIERHVEEIARRLVTRGHSVDVFTRANHPYREPFHAGVRLRRRPSIPTKHLDTATHTALCTLETIWSGRYDLLHVHGIGPGLFIGWAHRHLPTVFTYHAQDWRQRKWGRVARWSLLRGEATAVRRARAVVVVSRQLQRYVRDTYGVEARYIPNGATTRPATRDDALHEWRLQPGGYFLFVGRLIADRGVGTLLDAFVRLETDRRLVIVGDAHLERRQYEALRRRADERVLFTGYQPESVLQQLYAHAYLCVHPSEVEGLPIAVLEAMGQGRTVVVSDIPENLEAVGTTGVSFPVGNPDALRNLLARLLADPERVEMLGCEAQQRIARFYDWDGIAGKVADLYSTLCP
jgi:glycosyltransferase involved in cell wall biosynthesis